MSDEQEWVRITRREYDRLTTEIVDLKAEIEAMDALSSKQKEQISPRQVKFVTDVQYETLMQVIERLARRDETE